MAVYLEDFDCDDRLGDVFADLYGMSQATIRELDSMREGSGSSAIPGAELAVNDIKIWPPGGGYFLTRSVLAMAGVPVKLFASTSFYRDGYVAAAHVEANRGREIGGDYSIGLPCGEQMDDGSVVIDLRARGAEDPVHDEPLGLSRISSDIPLRGISTSSLQRLEAVSQGIIHGIAAAEEIKLGAPAAEVLGIPDDL